MKKHYFMIAAAATLFAACSETDMINEISEESVPQAIGFETFANKATRAENSSETSTLALSNHHTTFKVWGYKNTAASYVFDGVEVSYTDSKWSYGPVKYWDKAANTYEFYAAAPASQSWILNKNTDAQNDNYFTLADFTLTDETLAETSFVESFSAKSNVDLMIASPEKVEEAAIKNASKVEFDFNHILSRLNITIKKDATVNLDVALTDIDVVGLVNKGSFSEETAADAAGSNARWTTTSDEYTINGNELSVVTTDASYVLQSLVIPQNAAYELVDNDGSSDEEEPYLYLKYTIDGEVFEATYNLAKAFGLTSGNLAFNEGWQNTLNITIKPNLIAFDAKTFIWEDATPYDLTIE